MCVGAIVSPMAGHAEFDCKEKLSAWPRDRFMTVGFFAVVLIGSAKMLTASIAIPLAYLSTRQVADKSLPDHGQYCRAATLLATMPPITFCYGTVWAMLVGSIVAILPRTCLWWPARAQFDGEEKVLAWARDRFMIGLSDRKWKSKLRQYLLDADVCKYRLQRKSNVDGPTMEEFCFLFKISFPRDSPQNRPSIGRKYVQ